MVKKLRMAGVLVATTMVAFVVSGQSAWAAGPKLADTGSDVSMFLALVAAVVVAVGGAFIFMWARSGKDK
jgi:LPXTG-motif cell wall-anchored protein